VTKVRKWTTPGHYSRFGTIFVCGVRDFIHVFKHGSMQTTE